MCMPLQGFRSTYTISTPECSLHLCVAAEWLLTHLAMQTNTSHAQAQAHTGAVHPATQGRRIQRRALPQRGPRPPPRGLSAAQHSPPATPQKRCRAARQRGHPRLPGLQAAAPWGGRRAARRQLHTRPLSRLRQAGAPALGPDAATAAALCAPMPGAAGVGAACPGPDSWRGSGRASPWSAPAASSSVSGAWCAPRGAPPPGGAAGAGLQGASAGASAAASRASSSRTRARSSASSADAAALSNAAAVAAEALAARAAPSGQASAP